MLWASLTAYLAADLGLPDDLALVRLFDNQARGKVLLRWMALFLGPLLRLGHHILNQGDFVLFDGRVELPVVALLGSQLLRRVLHPIQHVVAPHVGVNVASFQRLLVKISIYIVRLVLIQNRERPVGVFKTLTAQRIALIMAVVLNGENLQILGAFFAALLPGTR